jgi:hypothetical protein
MAEVLAVLAALAFALGTVLQQRGTLEAPAAGGRFLLQILHRPVWLGGLLLQVCGWVLQAAALNNGPLILVQGLIALSLVLALPFGAWLTAQHVGLCEVGGAAATFGGIVLFLTVGSPEAGTARPDGSAWVEALVVSGGVVALLATLARSRSGAVRAALLAGAAGVAFGLQAAVTKLFVGELGHGLGAILSSWPPYALMVSAVLGFVLQQTALRTGVLAPAIAASNAVTLFSSVVLGLTVYGESLANGAGTAPALLGFGVALAGVVMLGGSHSCLRTCGRVGALRECASR